MKRPKFLERDLLAGNYLALCTTEELFKDVLHYLGVKHQVEWMGGGFACHHEFEQKSGGIPVSVVCIKVNAERTGIATAAMLAHEAMHAVQSSFEAIGEKNPGRETEAYALQSVLGYLLEEYVRQTT